MWDKYLAIVSGAADNDPSRREGLVLMVSAEDSGSAEQFSLSTLEVFALHALCRQMMRTDLRNEKNAKARERKRERYQNR